MKVLTTIVLERENYSLQPENGDQKGRIPCNISRERERKKVTPARKIIMGLAEAA
jgi:hypothetical protein